MNSTTLDRELHKEKAEIFNVVIAYEDSSAGQRAKRAYEEMINNHQSQQSATACAHGDAGHKRKSYEND